MVELGGGDGLPAAEIGFRVGVVADEFPIAATDGHLLAEAPKDRVVRGAGFFAIEKRQEIHALEFPFGFFRDAGGGERGGVEIELDRRLIEDAGFHVARP